MAKKVTTKFVHREAPMGLGPMAEKSSTGLPTGGGSGGKEVRGGAPDSEARPDGAGSMNSRSMDAGSPPARNDIGATVPSGRHSKTPL